MTEERGAAGSASESAPAKVNLVLHVGPPEPTGLHSVCSLFASIDLCDTVRLSPADRDEVVCAPPIDGPNLAAAALDAFRSAVPDALPPMRVEIEKRIPVAAGLGGGSADAAAVLRAANRLAGEPLAPGRLRDLAAPLGSDEPSQVEPRHALVSGTGERVEPVELPAMTLLVVPASIGLSTAAVYAEADRIGATRAELDAGAVRALAALPLPGLAARLENDLEAAAVALRPELVETRESLLRRSALAARVTGSGPTVFGVFADRAAAEAAAGELDERALVVGLRD
ncbi:MAG: 4-diphosphocytidyl-2-C-methyl-D-erythritol kinase [Thermoleophilaceae bacterium]|nr:4-diphosphocytidyl-2-C-methyl-D-erythritol kinase [Thermoleophilaceae bacterium]